MSDQLSSKILLQVLEAIDGRVADVDSLLVDIGLNRKELSEPDVWVSAAKLDALWKRAVVVTRDPNFGLTAASLLEPKHLGVFGYVVAASADASEAITRLAHFKRLTGDVSIVTLEADDQGVRYIHQTPAPPLSINRHHSEWGLAALVRLLRKITGKRSWAPLEISFAHREPHSTQRHREVFGCMPRFGAEYDSILMSHSFLASQFQGAEAVLSGILESHASRLLAELPKQQDFLYALQSGLQRELAGGNPTIERLAEKMSLSVRSLQRRLEEHQLTFKEVLDEMRGRLAIAYLDSGSMSVSEVAFLLGYSDSSVFARAFRRWHQVSPKQWQSR